MTICNKNEYRKKRTAKIIFPTVHKLLIIIKLVEVLQGKESSYKKEIILYVMKNSIPVYTASLVLL